MNFYTLYVRNSDGNEERAVCAFNAKDEEEASDKVFRWTRYQGFLPSETGFRRATPKERQYNLHNEWLR